MPVTLRTEGMASPFDKLPAAHVLSNFCPFGPSKLCICARYPSSRRRFDEIPHSENPCFSLILSAFALAQDVASFEKRVTVKKLANGLTLIVCERPEAPVFSFFTLVDAGSAQDPMLATGLAHMFEHMAFKGTDKIGTTDYAAEKPALEKVEIAYAAYLAERDKSVGQDAAKLKELEKAWKDAIAAADKYVKPNEFGKIVEQNGGEDMNAFTNFDETGYHYSLPENRLELWAYLESERFLHPVMREFYKERNVVIEERRMRTDSNPFGRLLEQFTQEAFAAHPYHRPTVGWMADLNHFSATDAQNFFDTILHSLEYGRGCRRRREGCASHADPGEIFRPPAHSPASG